MIPVLAEVVKNIKNAVAGTFEKKSVKHKKWHGRSQMRYYRHLCREIGKT